MKRIIVFLSFVAFASCSANRHLHQSENHTTISESERDGSSFDKAIVIQEKSDLAGTTAEYAWLKEHYPDYKMVKQELLYHNKKPYDRLNFKTQDGIEKNIYFDISNSFGKGF